VVAAALATVRVWSTGRARLWLGFGLAKSRPRVARARARRQAPFAQECWPHVLACARKTNGRRKQNNNRGTKAEPRLRGWRRRIRGRCSLLCPAPARYARLCRTEQRATPIASCPIQGKAKRKGKPCIHIREHIRVAELARLPWV